MAASVARDPQAARNAFSSDSTDSAVDICSRAEIPLFREFGMPPIFKRDQASRMSERKCSVEPRLNADDKSGRGDVALKNASGLLPSFAGTRRVSHEMQFLQARSLPATPAENENNERHSPGQTQVSRNGLRAGRQLEWAVE